MSQVMSLRVLLPEDTICHLLHRCVLLLCHLGWLLLAVHLLLHLWIVAIHHLSGLLLLWQLLWSHGWHHLWLIALRRHRLLQLWVHVRLSHWRSAHGWLLLMLVLLYALTVHVDCSLANLLHHRAVPHNWSWLLHSHWCWLHSHRWLLHAHRWLLHHGLSWHRWHWHASLLLRLLLHLGCKVQSGDELVADLLTEV